MKLYCDAHRGARPRCVTPKLLVRGDLWIALLGPSFEEGIVGIGPTVAAVLRAFDTQYLVGQRPANETINAPSPPTKPGRSFTVVFASYASATRSRNFWSCAAV